jgi:hypothetical protein
MRYPSRRSLLALPLLILIGSTACPPSDQGQHRLVQDHENPASRAVGMVNGIVGPIWPHDSLCFLLTKHQANAGDSFASCVDSLERLARRSPMTPERRATLAARRADGLPAQPRLSTELDR